MMLPNPKDVASQFSRELSLPCLAIEGQAVDFRPRSRALLAPFLNGLGGAQGLAICEHELAVFLVGAQQNTPLATLQSSLRESQLDAAKLPFLQGALASIGRLWGASGECLTLGAIEVDPTRSHRPDVEAVLMAPAQRLDLQVTLQGYGSGRLSLLSS